MQSVKTKHHGKYSYQRERKGSREGQEKGARKARSKVGKKREACGKVGECSRAVQVIRPHFFKSNRPKTIRTLKSSKYIYKHN